MNKKGFRKIVLFILGVLVALSSTMFLVLLDTKLKSTVYTLFGLAVFGLGAGILQAFGALNSHDEENKHSWWIGLVTSFMSVALIMTTTLIFSDVTLLSYLASTENKLFTKCD